MKVLEEYKKSILPILEDVLDNRSFFNKAKYYTLKTSNLGGTVYLLGNGGSSGTCSHFASDLEKNANIVAETLSDSSKITCLANDFGYENIFYEYLNKKLRQSDLVYFLSVSGESENLIKAHHLCLEKKVTTITMTGRNEHNSLKSRNHETLNLYVNSNAYNIVENIHSIAMGIIVDSIIETSIYEP